MTSITIHENHNCTDTEPQNLVEQPHFAKQHPWGPAHEEQNTPTLPTQSQPQRAYHHAEDDGQQGCSADSMMTSGIIGDGRPRGLHISAAESSDDDSGSNSFGRPNSNNGTKKESNVDVSLGDTSSLGSGGEQHQEEGRDVLSLSFSKNTLELARFSELTSKSAAEKDISISRKQRRAAQRQLAAAVAAVPSAGIRVPYTVPTAAPVQPQMMMMIPQMMQSQPPSHYFAPQAFQQQAGGVFHPMQQVALAGFVQGLVTVELLGGGTALQTVLLPNSQQVWYPQQSPHPPPLQFLAQHQPPHFPPQLVALHQRPTMARATMVMPMMASQQQMYCVSTPAPNRVQLVPQQFAYAASTPFVM
jgi:hypothetical protein